MLEATIFKQSSFKNLKEYVEIYWSKCNCLGDLNVSSEKELVSALKNAALAKMPPKEITKEKSIFFDGKSSSLVL